MTSLPYLMPVACRKQHTTRHITRMMPAIFGTRAYDIDEYARADADEYLLALSYGRERATRLYAIHAYIILLAGIAERRR